MDRDQKIIDSYFIQDGAIMPNGSKQKSIILMLLNDLDYCIQLPKVWTSETFSKIKLNPDQYANLQTILPSLTVILLFCTAVDVYARLLKLSPKPRNNETNGQYFKDCSIELFKLTDEEARELWSARCGISHAYRLITNRHAARQFGYGKIMRKREEDGKWEFYLHAMRTTLNKVNNDYYSNVSNKSNDEKRDIAKYIEKYGFLYVNSSL